MLQVICPDYPNFLAFTDSSGGFVKDDEEDI
jgi:hypothetical protein